MTTDVANSVASVGVFILLFAYFMQLAKVISTEGMFYLGLNVVGGAIAATSSYFLNVTAFVVLEGTWSLMALYFLVKLSSKKKLGSLKVPA